MVPTIPLSVQLTHKFLAKAITQLKNIQFGKEEVQVSPFTDDMTEYINNPENFTREPL